MRTKLVILQILLLLGWLAPAFADSRSVTLRVSCTVEPMIGLSASQAQRETLSNIDLIENWTRGQDGRSQLLTLTAR